MPTNTCGLPLQLLLQANGSLLLATTSDEVQQLEARAAMLQQQGVPGVVLLSLRELKMLCKCSSDCKHTGHYVGL
jgi:hypothetical protein